MTSGNASAESSGLSSNTQTRCRDPWGSSSVSNSAAADHTVDCGAGLVEDPFCFNLGHSLLHVETSLLLWRCLRRGIGVSIHEASWFLLLRRAADFEHIKLQSSVRGV